MEATAKGPPASSADAAAVKCEPQPLKAKEGKTSATSAQAREGMSPARQKDKASGSPDRPARNKAAGTGRGGGKGTSKGQTQKSRGHHRKSRKNTADKRTSNAQTLAGGVTAGPILRHNKTIYAYGNYDQYYGQRHNRYASEPRMEALLRNRGPEFFSHSAVLDMGCGEGFIPLLAASLGASRVVGVDIDAVLISKALKHLRRLKTERCETLPRAPKDAIADSRFPSSFVSSRGITPFARKPLAPGTATAEAEMPSAESSAGSNPRFPYNVEFRTENVLVSEIEERRCQPFDVVMCLKLTKWVHLHWGDDGIKVLLHRCFRLLRPGGWLVLEAQAWPSYCSKKHLTPHARQNYNLIQFRPQEFNTYLVDVVGFEDPPSVVDGDPKDPLKRPLLVFRRPTLAPAAMPKTHPAPRTGLVPAAKAKVYPAPPAGVVPAAMPVYPAPSALSTVPEAYAAPSSESVTAPPAGSPRAGSPPAGSTPAVKTAGAAPMDDRSSTVPVPATHGHASSGETMNDAQEQWGSLEQEAKRQRTTE